MKRLTLLSLLCLCLACSTVPPQTYVVNLITPEGKVHKTWTIKSHGRPEVLYYRQGSQVDGYSNLRAPVGWYLDLQKE